VIAEDKVGIALDAGGRHGLVVPVGLGDVVFGQGATVDEDRAVINFHGVTGQADHTFDVRLGLIGGIVKHDQVSTVDLADARAVNELVDEDALLVRQRGHHTGAFDFNRLVNEQDEDGRDDQRKA